MCEFLQEMNSLTGLESKKSYFLKHFYIKIYSLFQKNEKPKQIYIIFKCNQCEYVVKLNDKRYENCIQNICLVNFV